MERFLLVSSSGYFLMNLRGNALKLSELELKGKLGLSFILASELDQNPLWELNLGENSL